MQERVGRESAAPPAFRVSIFPQSHQIPLRCLPGEPDALGAAELPVQGPVLDGFGHMGESEVGGLYCRILLESYSNKELRLCYVFFNPLNLLNNCSY